MTEQPRSGAPDGYADDRIGDLVRLAGRRPMPDPARMSSARAAARIEWTRIVDRRVRRLSWLAITTAALVVVVGAVWFGTRRAPAPAPAVEAATLETLTGTAFVTSGDSGRREIARAGLRLRTGDRIETPDGGRAAVAIDGGVSVRLDRGTSVVFDAAELVTLDRGVVYVDTGADARAPALRVTTAFGSVSHVGTQFEVALRGDVLGVRTREGTVVVERGDERWTSGAGERLVLRRDRAPERAPIPTFGPEWGWLSELPRPFRLEGARLPQFLDWASREQGLRWEYADPAMRDRHDAIVLHGSVEGLSPEEALTAVLPTCGLTFSRTRDRLVVAAAR